MNRSTIALILTTVSALVAHVSIYMPSLVVKYIVSGIGAVIAIIGAVILFTLRKPFVRIYLRKDWDIFNEGKDNSEYRLRIPYNHYKKARPSVQVESGNRRFWSGNTDIVVAFDESTNDIILATKYHEGLKEINFDHLDIVRVTIK